MKLVSTTRANVSGGQVRIYIKQPLAASNIHKLSPKRCLPVKLWKIVIEVRAQIVNCYYLGNVNIVSFLVQIFRLKCWNVLFWQQSKEAEPKLWLVEVLHNLTTFYLNTFELTGFKITITDLEQVWMSYNITTSPFRSSMHFNLQLIYFSCLARASTWQGY